MKYPKFELFTQQKYAPENIAKFFFGFVKIFNFLLNVAGSCEKP